MPPDEARLPACARVGGTAQLGVPQRARHGFEELAAYNVLLAGFDASDGPARSWGIATSGNYFDVLGLRPYRGRFFHRADEHGVNSAPYIVLGHAYWHARFNDDPAVIGRTVQ